MTVPLSIVTFFYCLVLGYYSDCAVVHFSVLLWYILHYALERCVKSTKRINSFLHDFLLLFQVSCGKWYNADFLPIFMFFCFTKPRSGKRTTFLQGPGKVVMVAICM